MSSKIVYNIYNYTNLTLTTQTQGDKHIENNADGLNGQTLTPLVSGDSDDYVTATITVTTGDHDGALTLNFLEVDDQSGLQIASLRCTDLKNPENPGVLIPQTNSEFRLQAQGYRSVNNARLIKIYLSNADTAASADTDAGEALAK